MLYIAGKRNQNRVSLVQDIMAFTNANEVELLINGKVIGKAFPD